MIPDIIARFLEDEAMVAGGGTRDKGLIPHFHRVSGWIVSQDRQTITCSIPAEFTRDLISSLEDNGQFALTVGEVASHEAYQFKGKYVDSRPCNEADLVAVEQSRERLVKVVRRLYGDFFGEEMLRDYILKPSIAIRFQVREIFLQTPGPGAGHRLVPPEEK